MFNSFFSGLYHQFMAIRLRAEMPGADEDLIDEIVRRNAGSQRSTQEQRRPFRNPFRVGEVSQPFSCGRNGVRLAKRSAPHGSDPKRLTGNLRSNLG